MVGPYLVDPHARPEKRWGATALQDASRQGNHRTLREPFGARRCSGALVHTAAEVAALSRSSTRWKRVGQDRQDAYLPDG